jgi:hypothetical protein
MAAVALVVIALAAPAAPAGGKVYKTPQQAFDAFVTAAKQEDWKAACATLTDDTLNKLTGGFILTGVFVKRLMEKLADKDKEGKLAEPLKVLNNLFEKHGLTKDILETFDLKKVLSEKDPEKAFAMIASKVKDRIAFVNDFVNALKKLPGKQGSSPLIQPADAALRDLQIDGNAARGTIVGTRDGKEERSQVRFRKLGDSWKIELELSTGGAAPKGAPPPPARSSRFQAQPILEAFAAEPALNRPR